MKISNKSFIIKVGLLIKSKHSKLVVWVDWSDRFLREVLALLGVGVAGDLLLVLRFLRFQGRSLKEILLSLGFLTLFLLHFWRSCLWRLLVTVSKAIL